MPETRNRISDKAVKDATGKSWQEWLLRLDMESARDKTHTDIVRLLQDGGYITNDWWAQMVTNRYETARGKRVSGQSADVGFEIGARRTFQASPQRAWDIVTSPEGLRVWLGDVSDMAIE